MCTRGPVHEIVHRYGPSVCDQGHLPQRLAAGPTTHPGSRYPSGNGSLRLAIPACSPAPPPPRVTLCVWGDQQGGSLGLAPPTSPTTHPSSLFAIGDQSLQARRRDQARSAHLPVPSPRHHPPRFPIHHPSGDGSLPAWERDQEVVSTPQ